MFRGTVFTSALLLSACVVSNATEIKNPQAAVASRVKELIGLASNAAGADTKAILPTDLQENQSPALSGPTSTGRSLATTPAPEPGSFLLFGAGLVIVGLIRRARSSS